MKNICVSLNCKEALEMTEERMELYGNYCLPCNAKAKATYSKPKVTKHILNPFVHFENGAYVLKDHESIT